MVVVQQAQDLRTLIVVGLECDVGTVAAAAAAAVVVVVVAQSQKQRLRLVLLLPWFGSGIPVADGTRCRLPVAAVAAAVLAGPLGSAAAAVAAAAAAGAIQLGQSQEQ